MARKKSPVTFLAKESRRYGLLLTDDELIRQIDAHASEDDSKLRLLCKHYRIQDRPRMFYELALALARELYPEPKKRGRKSKWTILNRGALVVEIERLANRDDPAHGVQWAAKQLANREPWKSFVQIKETNTTTPDPAEAFRKAYYDFKDDKWAIVMRDLFKMHEHEGTTAAWEERVADYVKNPHPI